MKDIEMNRLHATVIGRVQGVSYRYFVVEQANNLGLSGWVRNRLDGSVEVTAEGTHKNLEELLDALREGPPIARVASVTFEWLLWTGELNSFDVWATA